MGAAVVENGDSFNIIGGWIYDEDGITYTDKILKYNPDGGQWIEFSTTLREGKWSLTAIRVTASFIKTC